MKPPHNISIDFHDVGASVQVGCKRLAYTDLQQMLVDLSAYVNNPAATIKVMQERFGWPQEAQHRLNTLNEGDEVPDSNCAAATIECPYPFPRN